MEDSADHIVRIEASPSTMKKPSKQKRNGLSSRKMSPIKVSPVKNKTTLVGHEHQSSAKFNKHHSPCRVDNSDFSAGVLTLQPLKVVSTVPVA